MKILVLGALVVLLNLPVSEAHSILRIKEGGKEDTSIISDALGAVEDAFANLKKHQDEMSEHIKDFVVLQDQLDIPEVTKGRESKRFQFYTDYWRGLKRNWKHRKFHVGENGNMNLHDGLKIIVNIDLSQDTTMSPSQNTRNFPFRTNDDNARTTTTRTLASIPQKEGMSDSAKFLNVDSDIEISPEEDTNTSVPESLRLPITRDFKTSELEGLKIVFNELNSELGIPSAGRPIKEEKRESIAQITQSDLLGEADGQAMNDATNKINFLQHLGQPFTLSSALQASITLPFYSTTEYFAESSVPPIDYSLPPLELEQSSLSSWPDTTSVPSVSTVLPPIVPVAPPVTAKVVPATVTLAVPHESEHVGPPLADTLGRSNVFANVLQAGATILPDTRDSGFQFPIPDEFSPKRTIEKTIKVGAEMLARDTPLFRSFPNPLEPTRALKKGVEAGVEIISEATKDQNMFLNGSPNALRPLSKLGNVMLADTIMSGPLKSKQVPTGIPEDEGQFDSQESNPELSHERLLLPVSLLDIPESVETVTELKDVVPQSTENMSDIEERFTDISVTTSCPQILPENNQSPSNEALSKIEVDEACPVRNEIDYGITDINIPVDNTYKSEDKDEEKDENYNSYNNTKYGVSSAGRKRSDQPLEQILYADKKMIPTHFLDSEISLNLSQADSVIKNTLVGPPLIRNPKEARSKLAETAEIESPQKQLIPPIGVPLISLNLLNIVIVPPESKSSLTSPPPIEIPSMSLNFKASKPLIPSSGIPPSPIDLSQLLLNPFKANVPITDPVKTLNSGDETLSSTVPITELNEASSPVRMHQLEEGVSKAESANADKIDTKALLPTDPVIPFSKIPPTTDINQLSPNPLKTVEMPPALNPLKGAAEVAKLPIAVEANAKQLSAAVSVIPPLTETPQLSQNLFEAEWLVTRPADALKSGDKTLPSVAPVIPPNEEPSPVSPNPHETTPGEVIPARPKALRPTVSQNEMLPPTETLQQSLNLLESSIATAHLTKALEPASEASSSTASNTSPNETASPVEMPYESLHPHDSDPAITESANTAEQLSNKAPSNILQPVDVPQLSLNTFSADGAIVDPTKNLGSADGTLLSAGPSIQPKGTPSPADEASPPIALNTSPNETALPVEMPYVSLHPQDSGPAIVESPNKAEQLSTTAPSRLQPVDVPQSSLNTFSADGVIVDPTKNLGSADGTLLSAGPSIQPKGTASPADEASSPIASNTSPNETASSVEVPHESLHPQDSDPAIVESPNNAEQLSTAAPSRLQPVDVPQSSLNAFSADGVIVDPTKYLGSADRTLLSTVPSIQSKGTALPIDIPFSLLNPLEEGVAMDDPTKTLEPFGKALSFTVPVIPSNGTASSDGIRPLIHDPFGPGVGTAESEIGILTGTEAVTPTMPLNYRPSPIYVPQLPLNSFNPRIAMAAPATPFESASQALSSSDILPNGTVTPIETPPVSPSAKANGSGDGKISSTASDILPNGKVSLIETRSTPLHPHESGLEASESAKSSEGGTEELSPIVSSPLPGITPPTEVPHLSLDTFGTDVVATDLLKDVASDDRTLSSAVPFIQSKETAISGDLPSLLLNPLEVGVTMANPTKAFESFGEAVSLTVPVLPSNGTASSDGIPPLIHDPFGAGVGKDESAKRIQTVAKAPTESSSNIPPPFEAPQLSLNSFDPGINMANPTVPFESASEAISSSVSDTLLTETVSSVEISPVSPRSNAVGSDGGTLSKGASVISQNGTVSPADIPAMSLPHESGLGIVDPAKASEKDTEELSHKPSSTSPGEIPSPDEVPHLPLSTFGADVTVADPTSYLGSDDKTRSSTVPIIQPEETALPVRIQSDQANTPESVGKAPSFSAPIKTPNGTVPPPLMLNLFGGAIFRTESSNSVQIGAKASSIDIPKQSPNSFMDDLATALEPSINAPTVSIRPSKKISSQVELPPTSLNPIDAGLEITESSKIAGKYTANLSTTGPVTSPSEISEQSAKPTETNAAQLSGTGEIVSSIGVPQLSQNPLEADVDPAKFPESDGEASTASENPSTISTPQFSVNLFEVGLATVNPPKALEPVHKALSSPVPIETPTGKPNTSPAVATNLTGVEPSKMSLGDGAVPSDYLEINSAAKTNADLLKQEVLSIPHSAAQRASVVFPFSPFNLDSEVTRSSSVPSAEASVPEHQDNASKLSTQIPLTIDLPIIPPNLSESVSASTVAAVTEELSSKSPLIPSSMPNIPWLTTPITLRISSLPAEATTLKQSSVGIKLSEVSEVAEASVTQQQNNVKAASELSTQIPLTIDSPIISSSPSESVASSTFAVVPEVHANVTEELSSKSPLMPSSMPNIPWLTTPIPLKVSSLPIEAATLKQSAIGIKLSEVPEIAEAGPKLTRSTFSKEPHISEELDEEIIEMESSDLASDWNRDMLGKAPIPSAASSIIEMDFGRKDPRSLYKIFNIMRDLSGKKLKNSGTSTNI